MLIDVEQLGQLVAIDDGLSDDDLTAAVGAGRQQVALGADGPGECGHQLLADGVERRVGHLGKQLDEVVVDQSRSL